MAPVNAMNQPAELRPHALGVKITQELDDIVAAAEGQELPVENNGFWAYQIPMAGVRCYGFRQDAERRTAGG